MRFHWNSTPPLPDVCGWMALPEATAYWPGKNDCVAESYRLPVATSEYSTVVFGWLYRNCPCRCSHSTGRAVAIMRLKIPVLRMPYAWLRLVRLVLRPPIGVVR